MPYLIYKGIENHFGYAGKWQLSSMRISLSKKKAAYQSWRPLECCVRSCAIRPRSQLCERFRK